MGNATFAKNLTFGRYFFARIVDLPQTVTFDLLSICSQQPVISQISTVTSIKRNIFTFRQKGLVVHVSSSAACIPIPLLTVYSASKVRTLYITSSYSIVFLVV